MHTPPMAAITGLALSSISLITVRRLGWAERLGGAEFTDVGTAGEPRARPDQHDRVDAAIGIRAPKRSDQGLTQLMTKTVDRGIFESENGDCRR